MVFFQMLFEILEKNYGNIKLSFLSLFALHRRSFRRRKNYLHTNFKGDNCFFLK